jgi:deoxyribose-phosphate aldolase
VKTAIMTKFDELFLKFNSKLNDEIITNDVNSLLEAHLQENNRNSVLSECLGFIDLTSLNSTDTETEIVSMVDKVNQFSTHFPQYSNVAAVCVYPSLVPTVKQQLVEPLGIASVAAGFPASQTFIEIKVAEVAMARMEGATEIDVVIPIGKFLQSDFQEVYEQLSEIKEACRGAHLKVIIESGALPSATSIYKASILSLASGADFIKTSTGKMPVAATPQAAWVMCKAIKDWSEKTGERKGFKAAGGIVSVEDALVYYTIVKQVLGNEWLNNSLFRIGASRLANNLLSALEEKDVLYF